MAEPPHAWCPEQPADRCVPSGSRCLAVYLYVSRQRRLTFLPSFLRRWNCGNLGAGGRKWTKCSRREDELIGLDSGTHEFEESTEGTMEEAPLNIWAIALVKTHTYAEFTPFKTVTSQSKSPRLSYCIFSFFQSFILYTFKSHVESTKDVSNHTRIPGPAQAEKTTWKNIPSYHFPLPKVTHQL